MRTRRLAPIFERLLSTVTCAAVASSVAGVAACSSSSSTGSPDAAVDTGFPPCGEPITRTVALPDTCAAAADAGDAGDAAIALDAAIEDGGACSCQTICGNYMRVDSCDRVTSDGGASSIECKGTSYCFGGRRPRGLRPCAVATAPSVKGFLVRSAHLEAASVDAFRILESELAHHGAPRRLLAAARTAARDERLHARIVADLAGLVAPPIARVRRARKARSLEAIAVENAREGCVRETFAALLAGRQARRATSARVRSAMERIARDETRHAELSFRVAEWVTSRLSPAGRKRVERVRRAAIASLRRELGEMGPENPSLGLPSAAEAVALLDALEHELAINN